MARPSATCRHALKGTTGRHDDVYLETNQLCRQRRGAIRREIGPALLDGDVLSLDVAQFPQPLPEGLIGTGRPEPGRLSLPR